MYCLRDGSTKSQTAPLSERLCRLRRNVLRAGHRVPSIGRRSLRRLAGFTSFRRIARVQLLMTSGSAARDQRDALTQAGAGIAVSRRTLAISRGHFQASSLQCLRVGEMMTKTLAPLVVAVSLLAGCALSGHPHIADIKYNPGHYQNRSVTVDGVVTSSWGVPLLPVKLYKVDDGTGEVTVVASNGRVPSKGARVS